MTPLVEIIHRSDFCPVFVDEEFVGVIMYVKGKRINRYMFYSNNLWQDNICRKYYEDIVEVILDRYWGEIEDDEMGSYYSK